MCRLQQTPSTAKNPDHPQLPVAGELHKFLLGGVVFCVFYFPVMSIYLPVRLFRCREGPYLPSPNEVSLAVFCFRKCAGLRCFPSCPYFVFCSFVRVLVAVLSPFHSPLPPFVYIAKKPRSEKLPRRAITWVYRPAKHTGHPGSAPGVSSCVSFCSVLCLSFVMVIVNSKSPHSWPRKYVCRIILPNPTH